MTFDHAYANFKFASKLVNNLSFCGYVVCNNEFYYIHCCTHIINTNVQDSLKDIYDFNKICDSNKYVGVLLIRKEKFKESMKLKILILRKDWS